MQLQQRTWLIHWSLFVFFNHQNGRNGIIDMFFQDKYVPIDLRIDYPEMMCFCHSLYVFYSLCHNRYLNTIQTTCPHVLRYLTAAVITNKRRRNVLMELVKVIQQESDTYRDPITELLEDLYVTFDFDAAQLKLRECEKVIWCSSSLFCQLTLCWLIGASLSGE